MDGIRVIHSYDAGWSYLDGHHRGHRRKRSEEKPKMIKILSEPYFGGIVALIMCLLIPICALWEQRIEENREKRDRRTVEEYRHKTQRTEN